MSDAPSYQLHDAVLRRVAMSCEDGVLSLSFSSREGPRTVTALDLVDFRFPQLKPWGASMCVNTTVGPLVLPDSDGVLSLEIEMQSGDVIEVKAREFRVENLTVP